MKRNNCKKLKPINVIAKFTIRMTSLKLFRLFRKTVLKNIVQGFWNEKKIVIV